MGPYFDTASGLWKYPKGTRIRLRTKERGFVEFALDENGKAVETVPETVTALDAWFLWPNGTVTPAMVDTWGLDT